MTIRYEENRIYTAECNVCGCLFTVAKGSQTEMELFMKSAGWEIWKSRNAHQPNCVCFSCKAKAEAVATLIEGTVEEVAE